MAYIYPVELAPDEGGFVVRFPDFPDGLTEGNDEAEALRMAADCLEEMIAFRILEREDIPSPSRRRHGQHAVALPSLMAAKAALHQSMRDEEVSINELARRLGWQPGQVRRLLNPRHHSRLDLLDKALAAVGKHLVVEVRKALELGSEPTAAEQAVPGRSRRGRVAKPVTIS